MPATTQKQTEVQTQVIAAEIMVTIPKMAQEANKANKVLSNASIELYMATREVLNAFKAAGKEPIDGKKAVIDSIKEALKTEDEDANIASIVKIAEIAYDSYRHGISIVSTHTTFANIANIVHAFNTMEKRTTPTEKKPAEKLFYTELTANKEDTKPTLVNFAHYKKNMIDMIKSVVTETKKEVGKTQKGDMLEIPSASKVYKNERKIYSNKLKNKFETLDNQYTTEMDDAVKIAGALKAFGDIAALPLTDNDLDKVQETLAIMLKNRDARKIAEDAAAAAKTPVNTEEPRQANIA